MEIKQSLMVSEKTHFLDNLTQLLSYEKPGVSSIFGTVLGDLQKTLRKKLSNVTKAASVRAWVLAAITSQAVRPSSTGIKETPYSQKAEK